MTQVTHLDCAVRYYLGPWLGGPAFGPAPRPGPGNLGSEFSEPTVAILATSLGGGYAPLAIPLAVADPWLAPHEIAPRLLPTLPRRLLPIESIIFCWAAALSAAACALRAASASALALRARSLASSVRVSALPSALPSGLPPAAPAAAPADAPAAAPPPLSLGEGQPTHSVERTGETPPAALFPAALPCAGCDAGCGAG